MNRTEYYCPLSMIGGNPIHCIATMDGAKCHYCPAETMEGIKEEISQFNHIFGALFNGLLVEVSGAVDVDIQAR